MKENIKTIIIDREKYKINDNKFYKEEHPKSQIIIGSTNRKSNYYLIRKLNSKDNNDKTWNTYTINRDGVIFEHYNPVYYTDFFGDQNIDIKSVSILLENMGPLYYNYDNNNYYNDLNEKFEGSEKDIFFREWRGYECYEPYTQLQYESLLYLCKLLCLELNIKDDSYGHNAFEENSKYFNGIVSCSNLDVNINNLNPSFNFKKLYDDLKK